MVNEWKWWWTSCGFFNKAILFHISPFTIVTVIPYCRNKQHIFLKMCHLWQSFLLSTRKYHSSAVLPWLDTQSFESILNNNSFQSEGWFFNWKKVVSPSDYNRDMTIYTRVYPHSFVNMLKIYSLSDNCRFSPETVIKPSHTWRRSSEIRMVTVMKKS